MDLMNLLKSVEELLYELVSWLVFYPLTLWKCLRHPLAMMDYAEAELADGPRQRYAAALSPPIFLFLTLAIAHLIELRFGLPVRAMEGVLADQRNLLLFRAVLFSLFPLMLAVQRVRGLGLPLTRETLRAPFYSQCYAAAPFILSFDLAMIILRYGTRAALAAGALLFGAGLIWYVAAETRWFVHRAGMRPVAALLRVVGTMLVGAVIFVAVTLLTALVVFGDLSTM